VFNKWNFVIDELRKHHPKNPKTVIFPNSSLQIDSNLIN